MPELDTLTQDVRRFDNDRFVCALFAPPAEREALTALYAFNLEVARVRESVRETLLGHMRLQWWRDALDGIFAGQPSAHPVAQALSTAVERFSLSREPFDRLLAARAADMDDQPPEDLRALEAYAEATSATLCEVSLGVFGTADGPAVDMARHLGIAWSMIGLVRAVPFHAQAGRSYLPRSLCRQHGVGLDGVFTGGGVVPGLDRVIADVAAAAGDHLAAARAGRWSVPGRALPVMLPAVLADGHLRSLARAGYDPFDARVQRRGPWQLVRLAAHAAGRRY